MKTRILSLLPFLLFLLLPTLVDAQGQPSINDVVAKGTQAAEGLITLGKTIFTVIIIIGAIYIGYAFFQGNPKAREMVLGFIVVLVIYAIVLTYV
jgi:magnesium-transporting ATPase (P-type)